jgi:hypothetical protein
MPLTGLSKLPLMEKNIFIIIFIIMNPGLGLKFAAQEFIKYV